MGKKETNEWKPINVAAEATLENLVERGCRLAHDRGKRRLGVPTSVTVSFNVRDNRGKGTTTRAVDIDPPEQEAFPARTTTGRQQQHVSASHQVQADSKRTGSDHADDRLSARVEGREQPTHRHSKQAACNHPDGRIPSSPTAGRLARCSSRRSITHTVCVQAVLTSVIRSISDGDER